MVKTGTRRSLPLTRPGGGSAGKVGDRVEAGATLLVIDSSDITAAYSEFVKEASELEYSTRAQELAKEELYATKALALKDPKQAENDLIKARAEFCRAKERLLSCGFRP